MSIEATLSMLRSADRPILVVEPEPAAAGRVAILPGSFDPITIAHIALAKAARDWADIVVLTYSVRTIAKQAEPQLLTEHQRMEQLRRVAAAGDRVVVGLSSHGLLVDQIRAARDRFPAAELRLVIGSDKVIQLFDPDWYDHRDEALARLFVEADVAYAVREGERTALHEVLVANGHWADRFAELDVSPEVAAVSSRSVRVLLRRGQDVTHLIPPEVLPLLRDEGVLP